MWLPEFLIDLIKNGFRLIRHDRTLLHVRYVTPKSWRLDVVWCCLKDVSLCFLFTVEFSRKGHITRYKMYHYAYKTQATANNIKNAQPSGRLTLKCVAHRQSFYKLVQPFHRYFIIQKLRSECWPCQRVKGLPYCWLTPTSHRMAIFARLHDVLLCLLPHVAQ